MKKEPLDEIRKLLLKGKNEDEPIHILQNKNRITLQYYGWQINLHRDNTWHWEATDGG